VFDDLAKDVASTLTGVFGDNLLYTSSAFTGYVNCVIRRDVETFDDNGQVVGRVHTLRIAQKDITFVPQRGDTVEEGGTTYTIGRRISDDGYSLEYEVST
jgi:hypothetical protein